MCIRDRYEEILKDGQIFRNLIGVSLVTAKPVSLRIQSGYIADSKLLRTEEWNSLYEQAGTPFLFFNDGFEESTLNLVADASNYLELTNDRFAGKTFVHGGSQNDAFDIQHIAGQTFIHGGNRDDSFQVEAATSCLLYTSPSPRDQRGSRMPSSA